MTQRNPGTRSTGSVTILRDDMGIPHILGGALDDCRMALGFAMATDRLWQLDYLRRRASGLLAEALGPSAVSLDEEARVVGFRRIARRNLRHASPRTRRALAAFAAGVNRVIDDDQALPPEFARLDYRPERWTPVDSLAIWSAFAWQLSGRLHWLTGPEVVLRHLPPGLAHAFLEDVGSQVSIVGNRRAVPSSSPAAMAGSIGSNAWAVAAERSATGFPIVASDPHLPLVVPSVWYESHLVPEIGAPVAGIGYVGLPTFVAGRNDHVAWGITNNLCSTRDLYVESSSTLSRLERIHVRDTDDVVVKVRRTPLGPVVNRLLGEPFRSEGPISLRWTGFMTTDEVGVMLDYEGAASVPQFCRDLADWVCPTWNFVVADDSGDVAYQCAGTIPVRGRRHLGIRRRDEPRDAWTSLVGTMDLPSELRPERGWVATANNLVSFDDAVTVDAGIWPGSDRAERIATMLEKVPRHSVADTCHLQLDTLSLRAVRLVPVLLQHLSGAELSDREFAARSVLDRWDRRFDREGVGSTIFEAFFQGWMQLVVAERFAKPLESVVAPRGEALAGRLLEADGVGWFNHPDLEARVVETFRSVVAQLLHEMGPEIDRWQWGAVHRVLLRHPLANELGPSATLGPVPTAGGWNTVNNAAYDLARPFDVATGVSHRLVAVLGPGGGLLSASSSGGSGDPTSPHYGDGLAQWAQGMYHELWETPVPAPMPRYGEATIELRDGRASGPNRNR